MNTGSWVWVSAAELGCLVANAVGKQVMDEICMLPAIHENSTWKRDLKDVPMNNGWIWILLRVVSMDVQMAQDIEGFQKHQVFFSRDCLLVPTLDGLNKP